MDGWMNGPNWHLSWPVVNVFDCAVSHMAKTATITGIQQTRNKYHLLVACINVNNVALCTPWIRSARNIPNILGHRTQHCCPNLKAETKHISLPIRHLWLPGLAFSHPQTFNFLALSISQFPNLHRSLGCQNCKMYGVWERVEGWRG